MSRKTRPPTLKHELSAELSRDAARLNAGCQSRLGVTAKMFRTAKYLFYVITLLFSGYLIQYGGVEPTLAMLFAALLISGPEGLEAWLMANGAPVDDSGSDDVEKLAEDAQGGEGYDINFKEGNGPEQ